MYFISGDTMMSQDLEASGSDFRLGKATPLFRAPEPNYFGRNAFVVTPDGQRFLMLKDERRGADADPSIIVVQHWFEELKRLAPPKR